MTVLRRPARAATVGLGALAVLGILAACGGSVDKDDTFINAETSGILNIEGGECFDDPAYLESADDEVVLYVPCEEGADNQSYHFVHAPDGPWDRPELVDLGWRECGKDYEDRWTNQEESGLDYYPILPTEETWADGDRVIMCAVYNPDGELTASQLPLA